MKSVEFLALEQEAKLTYKDIQKRLSHHEACVEILKASYIKDSCTYFALLLTHHQDPVFILLPNAGKQLEKEYLTNYRRSTRHKFEDTLSYYAYWYPILEHLQKKQIQKIYLSPEGVYNNINLNTLYDNKKQQYVFEQFQIIQVSNTKEIVVGKGLETPKNVVLVGYPDYKAKTRHQNVERGEDLLPLENTGKEVTNIATIANNQHLDVKKMIEQYATKDTVLNEQHPSILHVATHGFFDPNTRITTQKMLQSGVILAGAEVLSAFEVMQMDLRGTELVCLSACETGLGRVQTGEGVYGLQRAFKVAGAKMVMMSLWKVNDEATQELMTVFYTNWLEKHQNKREAFLAAQEVLRRKYEHPYYWGAFVLVGD